MKFKKYGSIENSYRQKYVDQVTEEGFGNETYCVMEKIHGANFSIYCDGIDVLKAKRSGFISPNDDFMGYQTVMGKYEQLVLDLFKIVNASNKAVGGEEVTELVLRSELFGGHYPDTPNQNSKRIQRGVHYCPHNDIAVFDMMINGSYVNWVSWSEVLKKVGFLTCEPLFVGSFTDCMNYSNKFITTIPKMFNLPEIEGNYCEGVVIKPVTPLYFRTGQRVIFKNKNDAFKEVSKHKERKPDVEMPEEVLGFLSIFEDYITENRLRNVLSHIGPVSGKDFGKLCGMFTKDVIEDFTKDNEAFLSLEKAERKMCTKVVSKKCADFMRPHFLNIVDSTF